MFMVMIVIWAERNISGHGSECYILGHCVNAQWTLFSGWLHIRNLGKLDFEDSNGSESYDSMEAVLPDFTRAFRGGGRASLLTDGGIW
jgi:hypothetical protein